jgi:hypothetical protein
MLPLEVESWIWYAITWLLVMARLASRRLLLGSFKKLQLDDALMILAMVTDGILIASINIVSKSSSNLIDPNDHTELTPDNIKERVFGSKMVLVAEQMQCITIWLVKACLLLMYHRLTSSLKQNRMVKAVAMYTAFTFVLMEILYLGVWCRPFNQYWAVPPDNVQCSAATNHLITNTVFNISSDIMIIILPMPMLLQTTLSTKKKVILCGLFAVGTFTILSAILNKYYSFTQPFGLEWTAWYIRESSTALITANLPLTWALLQRIFKLRSWSGYSKERSGRPTNRASASAVYARSGTRYNHTADEDRTVSQERINRGYSVPLKIYQQHEVNVQITDMGSDFGENTSRTDGGLTTTVKGGGRVDVHTEETASDTSFSTEPVKVGQSI